jgi:hypothetical protein
MIPVVSQMSESSTSSVSETIVIVHAIRRRGDHTGKFLRVSVASPSARIAAALTITPHMHTCHATSELLEAQSSRLQMPLPVSTALPMSVSVLGPISRRRIYSTCQGAVANGATPGVILKSR